MTTQHRVWALRAVCDKILDMIPEEKNEDVQQALFDILADLEREIGQLTDVPDVQDRV